MKQLASIQLRRVAIQVLHIAGEWGGKGEMATLMPISGWTKGTRGGTLGGWRTGCACLEVKRGASCPNCRLSFLHVHMQVE